MNRLSDRLQLVYENLIIGEDVWDFCCDHGYLGAAAYKSQEFKNIYFVDPVPSIMQKLESQFNKYLLKEENHSKAYFRVQKGETITEPVRGTVSIIGVGPHVIYDILSSLAQNQHLKAQRLILGPHRDTEKLLNMLKNNKLFDYYKLTSQKEVFENDRSRIFLIFDIRN
jgi:tRNA (adenine22-N1)-methyltransferase